MKHYCVAFTLVLTGLSALSVSACHRSSGTQNQSLAYQQGPDSPALLISFEGKGTKLAWDVGGMWATYEHLSIPEDKIIFAGNSSGSILTAYFTCHGFIPASIARARDLVESFDRDLVNETKGKIQAALFGTDPSYPHENIFPFLDAVLMGCDPNTWRPMAIVAANNEVLELRHKEPGIQGGDKDFDYRANFVWMDGQVIGKACTYFVNQAMLSLMSRIPYEERLCDLRLMMSPDDVKFAILASVSEPTYFRPMVEMEPHKIVDAINLMPGQRWYNGGFIMSVLAQDIKRPLPFLRVLGSGRGDLSAVSVRFIRKRFLADMDVVTQLGRWWLDLEFLPSPDEWDILDRRRTSHQTTMALGCRRAHYCLNADNCLDPRVTAPYFRAAVGDPSGQDIPSRQGLRDIMLPAGSMPQTCPY